MKSFFTYFVLLFSLIILNLSFTVAQYNWTKDVHNPIFSGSGSGTWDSHVFAPNVLFNADSNRYEMWYGGSYGPPWRPYSIGFAWSEDGINWTKYANNPVLTPSPGEWDQGSVEIPTVIRENGQYKMWYTGWTDVASYIFKIGYAISDDGINWQKQGIVMSEGDSTWESQSVGYCSVKKNLTGYIMYYTGLGDDNGIGRAISVDGINWQRDTINNPLLIPGTPGQWDDFLILAPQCIIYIDTLYMYYMGGQNSKIGLATSVDGINWQKDTTHNPVLAPSPGNWDGSYVELGTVMLIQDTLHMWYDGTRAPAATNLWRIGHATSPVFVPANDTIYVPTDYSTIQEAIDASVNGNVILVADGIYYENINYKGKAITVASHFLIDGDSTHIENTIIDGSQPADTIYGSVVRFGLGEDTTSVLCGFTITGGKGTPLGTAGRVGGGAYIYNSTPIIKNNIFEYDTVYHPTKDVAGSALYILPRYDKTAIVEYNIIRNNFANSESPSGYVNATVCVSLYFQGNCIIRNNIISDNQLTGTNILNGGGIGVYGFNEIPYKCFIDNNIISNNTVASIASSYGGGIYVYDADVVVFNNLIYKNSATQGGGVLYSNTAPSPPFIPKFINNTIVENTAFSICGGISTNEESEISNCIIRNNTPTNYYGILATVTYSDVEGGYTGTGNIDLNPEFLDTTYFLLSNTSPCIDAGNPDPMYNDFEDPNNPGFALWPAQGTLINDMGNFGGPTSFWSSIITSVEEEEQLNFTPSDFTLFQNYPNPFNPTTIIKYGISERTFVELRIYDILGREVALLINEEQDAGYYELSFNAAKLSSGVYLYQIKAGNFIETKKMLLIK